MYARCITSWRYPRVFSAYTHVHMYSCANILFTQSIRTYILYTVVSRANGIRACLAHVHMYSCTYGWICILVYEYSDINKCVTCWCCSCCFGTHQRVHMFACIDRTQPHPPGAVPIYYVPSSRTVSQRTLRSTCYTFFEGGPLTHGSWWGNIVNRKPPRGGGGSFDQYVYW